jgi:hypothetical protein
MNDAVKKVTVAATTGTAAMTAFSYAATQKENKEFREPVVLAKLFKRLVPAVSDQKSYVAGWLMHYGAGVLFATAYHQLWKKKILRPTVLNGLLLGGINGIVGVAIWKATIKAHPAPPNISYRNYYKHLLLAHLIFGMGTAIGYKQTQ